MYRTIHPNMNSCTVEFILYLLLLYSCCSVQTVYAVRIELSHSLQVANFRAFNKVRYK